MHFVSLNNAIVQLTLNVFNWIRYVAILKAYQLQTLDFFSNYIDIGCCTAVVSHIDAQVTHL